MSYHPAILLADLEVIETFLIVFLGIGLLGLYCSDELSRRNRDGLRDAVEIIVCRICQGIQILPVSLLGDGHRHDERNYTL